MIPDLIAHAAKLSDRELLERIQLLAQREREATAALVAHLVVLDDRRLYLGEGFSSLFTYCTQILHLSEHAAYNRIEAARAARKFPVILEMLQDGSLTLTAVRLLAPELTPANHRDLLAAAQHKSKQQVSELIARLRPQPPIPSTIRRLPTRTASLVFSASRTPEAAEVHGTPQPPPVLDVHPPARPVVVPLTPERFKIQFTASRETRELLRRAQDLLRHQIPDGDVGEVMAKALKVLVEELEKAKVAVTSRSRDSRGSNPRSRHIPAEVKRKVWERDGGACAFVSNSGRRCGERAFLEFHYVVPYGAGGEATIDNIQLRCRAHNGYEAELYYGRQGPPAVREVRPAYERMMGSVQARLRFGSAVSHMGEASPPHADNDLVVERIVGIPMKMQFDDPVIQRIVRADFAQDGPHGISSWFPEPRPVLP